MWIKAESGINVRPAGIDTTSSQKYVYVRKNITLIEAGDDEHPAHYEWDEMKIPKDSWETFLQVMDHSEALSDVYAALAELAEIITEVQNG